MAQGAISANLETYVVAQHVGEKPGSFSVYWAVKDDGPIKAIADVKGKSVGINVFGSGIYGPMALLLKKHGVDRHPVRARRRRRAQPAVRGARGGEGRLAQAVFHRRPASQRRAHHGRLPQGLR
jgi:hypothetical protein